MPDHIVVIDGYNLIHRTPLLRPGPERSLAEAREKLINLLAWAIGSGEARFVVVFDGAQGMGGDSRQGRVEIRFSRPPENADTLIARVVEDAIEHGRRVTVVTADLEVARHARAMGADLSIADLFVGSVLGPRAPEAGEKPVNLSRKELEEWAELFGKPREEPE